MRSLCRHHFFERCRTKRGHGEVRQAQPSAVQDFLPIVIAGRPQAWYGLSRHAARCITDAILIACSLEHFTGRLSGVTHTICGMCKVVMRLWKGVSLLSACHLVRIVQPGKHCTCRVYAATDTLAQVCAGGYRSQLHAAEPKAVVVCEVCGWGSG